MSLTPRLRPLWAKYQPPAPEAVAGDLQRLRRDAQLTPDAVAGRYVLMHLPLGLMTDDLDRRAELVAGAIREAIAHDALTEEQRVIAQWSFVPPAALVQATINDRLQEARQVLNDEFPAFYAGEPKERSLKVIQDREAALIELVAALLLDAGFASSYLERQGVAPPVQPPGRPLLPLRLRVGPV